MGHPCRPYDARPATDAADDDLAVVDRSRALAELAGCWTRVVAHATFVPGPRARAGEVIEDLLRRLVDALDAEPFDPSPGYHLGAALVAARMSAPAVLGDSLTLLSDRLLTTVGSADDDAAGRRLTALLGQLAAGFTEALRGAAAGAAEELNRAERAAWRRQQRSLQRRLQYAMLHDPLTGLPTRATLLESLRSRIADAAPGDRLGVCVLAFERLGAVNDILGHEKGDQVLREVARHLRMVAVRRGLLLAHLAADEFALVLYATSGIDDMVKAVDALLEQLPEAFEVAGHRMQVTAKAGIVESVTALADPVDLLRSAHIALGWAVRDRQGPYAVFEPRRGAADVHRHNLAADMPDALAAGEFVLEYQPLVRLADRGVVGAEALVRWNHPRLGVLGPDQFIALAEQTGLIEPLGQYLLEQACTQAARWRRGGRRPFVSVNLAAAQLGHPGLTAAVGAVLDRTKLPADALQLEITESAAVAHHHALDQFASLGVRLAIDDFGTGYSSLAYLAELPVRSVKLASRFLAACTVGRGAGRSQRRRATILPNLIRMCHDLAISVTAEGVESAAQARRLRRLGCDVGQGFHLARPTSAEAIADMVRRGSV